MRDGAALVRVAENGRLSIPAKQRKLLGLEDGGVVVASVEGGELRLRPVSQVLSDIQARVRRYLANSGDSVNRFLEDRRAEAAKEEAEMEAHFGNVTEHSG